MGCHLSVVKAKRYKNRDAKSFTLAFHFLIAEINALGLFGDLADQPSKRAWQRESWRRVRRSGMGTSGVDAKLRPRCEPVMAELMCVAGSGNLRCTGCALREAICHFGRYSERTDVARKTGALVVR